MSPEELLKKFCSENRPGMREPFVDGEHTYATDGSVLVRIKGNHGNGKGPGLSDLVGLFHYPGVAVEITPSLLWKYRDKYLCKECMGSGVDIDDDRIECPLCDGLKYNEHAFWRLDKNSVILCRYLGKIIEHLGATKFFPATLNGEEAIPFVFKKGEGLLMPIRFDDFYKHRVINT